MYEIKKVCHSLSHPPGPGRLGASLWKPAGCGVSPSGVQWGELCGFPPHLSALHLPCHLPSALAAVGRTPVSFPGLPYPYKSPLSETPWPVPERTGRSCYSHISDGQTGHISCFPIRTFQDYVMACLTLRKKHMVRFLMLLNFVYENMPLQRPLWVHVKAGRNYINDNKLNYTVCQIH